MRVVLQRVSRASVRVEERLVGAIGSGLLILAAVGEGDGETDLDLVADKVVNLRIFPDAEGRMNVAARDARAELLVVSQFTLHADCRKGRRPSFTKAAAPERARELLEEFIEKLRLYGLKVETGQFGASMRVELLNEGPVTIILDSEELRKPRGA